MDFNLINRLKESFPSLHQTVSDEDRFLIGQGAMIGGGDKNDASHLIDKPFLDTRKDIKAFWVNNQPSNSWTFETVHRPRNPLLYKAPMLLITEGINKYFRSVSAISKNDVVYRSSLTALKIHKVEDIKVLSNCSKIINTFMDKCYSSILL